MLFVGRDPDDLARANFANLAAAVLHPAGAGDHAQRLAKRMISRTPRAKMVEFSSAPSGGPGGSGLS